MEDASKLEQLENTLRMMQTNGIDTNEATRMIVEYVVEHEAEDPFVWKKEKPIKDPSHPHYNPYLLPNQKPSTFGCCPISLVLICGICHYKMRKEEFFIVT